MCLGYILKQRSCSRIFVDFSDILTFHYFIKYSIYLMGVGFPQHRGCDQALGQDWVHQLDFLSTARFLGKVINDWSKLLNVAECDSEEGKNRVYRMARTKIQDCIMWVHRI